ncbi:hypothetical protein TrVGV298_007170 [Trichoderma virens]|nr:hypothetical protein TrVGV298_007170 [Trichoderma virens]
MFSFFSRRALNGLTSDAFVRIPRERTMPLVLKPFQNCYESHARMWNVFIPDLDVTKYMETLSKYRKTKFRNRAKDLAWGALNVKLSSVSEYYWEASAWHDVFGMIRNDDNLRADKRPYKFAETDDNGKLCVKTRIPDATFGIRFFQNIGDPAYRQDVKKKPVPLLCDNRLRRMMLNPECGLVVDGMWGETSLIFPFAAYEAKSGNEWNDFAVTRQIYDACRTYLAMLDDLARNPNNINEYQTNESSRFQFFGFTSFGNYWKVYVAWSSLEDCMVETIWGGDISTVSNALQLLYIVDQIHDYAMKHHFPFVLKHLEAWCARENQNPLPHNHRRDIPEGQPLWMVLDEASKRARHKQKVYMSEKKRNYRSEKWKAERMRGLMQLALGAC